MNLEMIGSGFIVLGLAGIYIILLSGLIGLIREGNIDEALIFGCIILMLTGGIFIGIANI